jgi:TonB family protein
MHTTLLLSLGVATAGSMRLAAQITVVKPVDPIPPHRLAYHPPQLLSCPRAEYPDSLKRRAIGGHVLLELVVDTLGRVPRDRIVVRETPHPGLAQAAIDMAAGCRFAPARVGRKAVGKVVTMPVDFGVVRATHEPGMP